jgi:MFS family permease
VDDRAKHTESETESIENLPIDPSTPLYRIRPFALLFVTRVASTTAFQMLSVVVGWHVYELTDSALHLGLIGLAQFLAPVLLMLPAGQIADRYNRRFVLRLSYAAAFVSSAGLMAVAALPTPNILAIYALIFLNTSARTFEQPLMQALLPVMAPRAVLGRAIAAHISARQISLLFGPALGGVLYIVGPVFDYGVCTALVLAAAIASMLLPNPGRAAKTEDVSWHTVLAGFRFIWNCQPVLGSLSLEFVSTLFGSVTALLPVYARDILDVGSAGAGILRSAAALGALIAAAALTRFPVRQAGGLWLFAGFAVAGASTIVFGLSTNIALSILALMVNGAGDMLSTVIRQTLIQVATPNPMRGRVFAVNSLFYGTSSQLGTFRAGALAEAIGAVGSVVIGGGAVLATVALLPWLFPQLRRIGNPNDVKAP